MSTPSLKTKPAKKKAPKAKPFKAKISELAIHPDMAKLPTEPEVIAELQRRVASCNPGQKADLTEALEEKQIAWAARIEDYRIHGFREPILVLPAEAEAQCKWWVVDGRHRFFGHHALGIEIASLEIDSGKVDVRGRLLSEALGRAHYSDYQKAFFALEIYPEYIEGGKPGRKRKLVLGEPINSHRDLATRIGVDKKPVDQAAEVHKACIHSPATAKLLRHAVMRGMEHTQVMASVGGQDSTAGKPKNDTDHMARFHAAMKPMRLLCHHWPDIESLGADKIIAAKTAFTEALQSLPEALKEHAKHILTEEAA